ncbi:MAG: hypothetical protein KC496_03580 [Anaerolineae bacterium]|nr:hypothetical protein [Anaerolineae bacterium]
MAKQTARTWLAKACSSDDTRPVLSWGHVYPVWERRAALTCDSYRMHIVFDDGESPAFPDERFPFPKAIAEGETAQVPDFGKVIPATHTRIAIPDPTPFLNGIKRAMVFGPDVQVWIRDDGTMTVSGISAERGDITTFISIPPGADEHFFVMRGQYLRDALLGFDLNQQVNLVWGSGSQYALVDDPVHPSRMAVIAPMLRDANAPRVMAGKPRWREDSRLLLPPKMVISKPRTTDGPTRRTPLIPIPTAGEAAICSGCGAYVLDAPLWVMADSCYCAECHKPQPGTAYIVVQVRSAASMKAKNSNAKPARSKATKRKTVVPHTPSVPVKPTQDTPPDEIEAEVSTLTGRTKTMVNFGDVVIAVVVG